MTRIRSVLLLLVVFLFMGGLGVWAVVDLLNQIQNGRRVGTRITCAVLSGVTEAGREVIMASANAPETPLTRNLEKLGYPKLPARRAAARISADAYVNGIASRVESAIGAKGGGLVKPNGTIDCGAFLRLAHVTG